MPTVSELFGIRTQRAIPIDRVCRLGNGTNVKKDPLFVFEEKPLKRILTNLRLQKPIWAWGPSGCGKTELFRQIAARLQRPCYVISFGEETSLRELLGTFELRPGEQGVTTRYRHGVLARAIQDPYAIVILDEFNMAPPGIAAQFNRVLEAREIAIPETGEIIRMAEGTVLVATANTAGSQDLTGLYAGSQAQNGATRNRFAGLRLTYLPPEKEREILLRRIRHVDPKTGKSVTLDDLIPLKKPCTELMVQYAQSVRGLIQEGVVSLPFSVRSLVQWGISTLLNGSVSEGLKDAYADLLDEPEYVAVGEVFQKVFDLDIETGEPAGRNKRA